MTGEMMEQDSGPNVHLAFMECFTSCLLTALNLKQSDYRKVLLDYWNLDYQFRTLLSSKDARNIPLDYLYGMEMKFVHGNAEKLLKSICDGNAVILFCAASRLSFFPRNFLTMESSGFQHAILIYGWDEQTGKYLVADPVVNICVQIEPKEILHAGGIKAEGEELHYFLLKDAPPSYSIPSMEACVEYAAHRNLAFYCGTNQQPGKTDVEGSSPRNKWEAWRNSLQKGHVGARALDSFVSDLNKSQQWEVQRRSGWINQNTRTIASIKHVRTKIWNVYCELAPLKTDELQEGQQQIDNIVNAWTKLNLLLIKYNAASQSGSIPAIELHVETLKSLEIDFLQWLQWTVRKGGRNEESSGRTN